MFGSGVSTKEWERQKHANELKVIESKAMVYNTLLSKANDDLVVLGKNALRKSFIHRVSVGTLDGVPGTRIHYFDFGLKGYLDGMTDTIFIRESDLTYEQIIQRLGAINGSSSA